MLHANFVILFHTLITTENAEYHNVYFCNRCEYVHLYLRRHLQNYFFSLFYNKCILVWFFLQLILLSWIKIDGCLNLLPGTNLLLFTLVLLGVLLWHSVFRVPLDTLAVDELTDSHCVWRVQNGSVLERKLAKCPCCLRPCAEHINQNIYVQNNNYLR